MIEKQFKNLNQQIEILKQDAHDSYSLSEQVISLFTIKHKLLENIDAVNVRNFERYLLEKFNSKHEDIMKQINEENRLDDSLIEIIKKHIAKYVSEFNELNEE